MRPLVVAIVLCVACSNRGAPPSGGTKAGEPTPSDAATAAPTDAATRATIDAAIDAAIAMDPWRDRPDTLVATLQREGGGSLVLVDEADGLVARTAAGVAVRTLVAGKTSRASYDPRTGVLWFVRGGKQEALDLTMPDPAPVTIVEDMPDIELDASAGAHIDHPFCDVCVIVQLQPTVAIAVTTAGARTGGDTGDDAARYAADLAAAEHAHPRLAANAIAFLSAVQARPPARPTFIRLDDATWPTPRTAGDLNQCDRTDNPRRGCCVGGCRRGFDLPALDWVLVVSGRVCQCGADRCWATCVLHDPARRRYAQPSRPDRWGADAKPEPLCQLGLDASGTSYILDEHRVCTARGCARVSGRILGWLMKGAEPDAIPEDVSACPEAP